MRVRWWSQPAGHLPDQRESVVVRMWTGRAPCWPAAERLMRWFFLRISLAPTVIDDIKTGSITTAQTQEAGGSDVTATV